MYSKRSDPPEDSAPGPGHQTTPAREALLVSLAAIDPAGMPAMTLLEEVTSLARFADQVRGHLARLVAAADATSAAPDAVGLSTAGFLRSWCQLSGGHAAALAHTARALPRLAATSKALDAGDISFDQAAAIAATAGGIKDTSAAADAERMLLLACDGDGLSVREVRNLGESLAYQADPDSVDDAQQRAWERRQLSLGMTLDRTGVINGATGDAASYEVIKAAVDAFASPAGADDRRTAAQRRMDGLAAACAAALGSGVAGTRGQARPHVTILLDSGQAAPGAEPLSQLTGVPGAPPPVTGHGTRLTAAQAQGFACDSVISAILMRGGQPLDVSPGKRTVSPALRRAVEARDLSCRWPGCDQPATWCSPHHIRHFAEGGRTTLANLVLLCWTHHMGYIHTRHWTIAGDPAGELRFCHPDGLITLSSGRPARRSP